MMARLSDVATVRQGLSRSGRSAAARTGDWEVELISGSNIREDRLAGPFTPISIPLSDLTEKHLLQPYDVLVTGKSTSAKAAYVAPSIDRAVANSTLLVVRPSDPDVGLFVWWYLTSPEGRAQVEARMVASATLSSLPPSALANLEVPLPSGSRLRKFAELIEASERAYSAAREAAELRRSAVRAALIGKLTTATTAREPSYAPD
jgi:restriction endonuclease S subunit